MKRYVIKPLTDDYIYVPISCTELESFACPIEDFKKIQINEDVKDREYYNKIQMKDEVCALGSMVESIIQATLLGGEKKGLEMARIVRENMTDDFLYYKRSKVVDGKATNKEWEFVYNNLENYVFENMRLYKGEWYYNTTNYRMYALVEFGKILFWLSWEVDTARFMNDDEDIIIDHKLSVSEWKEDTLEHKRQMYYYPFFRFISWIEQDNITFIYNVNRKLKNISWKTQFIEYKINKDDAVNRTVKDLQRYAIHILWGWEQIEHKDIYNRKM